MLPEFFGQRAGLVQGHAALPDLVGALPACLIELDAADDVGHRVAYADVTEGPCPGLVGHAFDGLEQILGGLLGGGLGSGSAVPCPAVDGRRLLLVHEARHDRGAVVLALVDGQEAQGAEPHVHEVAETAHEVADPAGDPCELGLLELPLEPGVVFLAGDLPHEGADGPAEGAPDGHQDPHDLGAIPQLLGHSDLVEAERFVLAHGLFTSAGLGPGPCEAAALPAGRTRGAVARDDVPTLPITQGSADREGGADGSSSGHTET